jgi:nicotinate phosphoribosyltransferase
VKTNKHSIDEGVLYTDQYQLTMAQLYYRMGLHKKHALFDYFFRSYPDYGSHKAGYCINAGLEWLLEWIIGTRFRDDDIDCLRSQTNPVGNRVFSEDFLDWLSKHGTFEGISLWGIPEGRVVHPNVPLVIVQGPLVMAQILETSLLNHLTYPTLIATKTSRIRESGRGQLLLEFGLRRAQGRSANAGTRAALIGGADFSSNVGISHALGYPPKGTHAHSMVQVFMALGEGELGAFRAYADVYPDNCILLVDTINTLESGIPNAIIVFEELRRKGHEPVGIRLDSGDLAFLSLQAAKMLDAAGFPDTKIVLSNQLDELVIWQIITQIQLEAPSYGVDPDHLINRLVYGVGTRLITSQGDPALDGVYKLTAVRGEKDWVPVLKVSETSAKAINPGEKRVWRLYDQRMKATVDLIGLEHENPGEMDKITLRHPTEDTKYRSLDRREISKIEPLLVEVIQDGKRVYEPSSIEELRQQRVVDIDRLDDGVKRLINPHEYHVSISERLWKLKKSLIASAR